MTPVIRAFDATIEVIDGERAVVATINTDAIDRYRTVIDPAGGTFANFLNAPAVLYNHGEGNDGKPIGRSAWVRYRKADRAIIAKTIFLEDEYSDGLFRMAQARVLNSYSVRIIPAPEGDNSSPRSDEIKKRPELVDCYWMYRNWDLGEYSLVNCAGNPEALALAVSRGLLLPDRLMHDLGGDSAIRTVPTPVPEPEPIITPEPISEPLPRLVGRTLAQATRSALEELRRSIPIEAKRAAQDRLDLLRGKV